MKTRGKLAVQILALLSVTWLVGCGGSAAVTGTTPVIPPVVPTGTGVAFGGSVLAGGAPLIGASVELYAAGTAGNGSAGTPLLTTALTTDSSGGFSVPGISYTCPATGSVLYVVATGGHIGTSGSSNTAIMLMSSPGACSSVTAGTNYVVNELTTVASAYAFRQFLGVGGRLGASSTNSSGLTLAAGTLANLVNIKAGTAPGPAFPATGTAATPKLSSLANAVNACVTASAGSAACASLFSDVVKSGTPPTNTLDAILDLVKNPAVDNGTVYPLTTASNAYAPTLPSAPADWTLFVTYSGGGMNPPTALSIDSKGNLWVASYLSTASLFTNTGTPVFATGITSAGLGHVYGNAVDANDVAWFTNEPCTPQLNDPCPSNNYNNSVTLLTPGGTAVSGSPFTAGGLNFPISIVVDATNVSWIVNYGNSSVTLLSNAGTPLSGASGYDGLSPTGVSNFYFPVAVAVDSNRNGWVANQSSDTVTKISDISATGATYTSYVTGRGPSGIAVDSANNVWVANYYGDSLGAISAAGSVLSGTGITGGGVLHPQGIAVDGANNVWVANFRGPNAVEQASISEVSGVGSAAGTGAAISPAVGWGADAGLLEPFALAIDASGNVWVTNFGSNTLTEFVGMAAPVKTPLSGAVRIP